MDDDHVGRAIEEIERGLLQDDREFVRRYRTIRRAEMGTAVTVILLLAVSSALLAVGVATSSWVAFGGGALVFLASFAIDEHHKHALQRTSGPV